MYKFLSPLIVLVPQDLNSTLYVQYKTIQYLHYLRCETYITSICLHYTCKQLAECALLINEPPIFQNTLPPLKISILFCCIIIMSRACVCSVFSLNSKPISVHIFFGLFSKTERLHIAKLLFSESQKMSRTSVTHSAIIYHVLLFVPHFDVICNLDCVSLLLENP